MHPLGCRGMLTGKWTLEHLQLSRINGQTNTPAYSLTFVGPSCTLRRLVHASLSNGKHSVHYIRSGNRSSCNRSFGVWAHFIPLMFLQGPYFSTWRFLGLSKAKSWWEHCCLSSHPSQPSHLSHPSFPSHLHHPCHSIINFYPRHPCHLSYLFTLIILASQPLLPHAVIPVPLLST